MSYTLNKPYTDEEYADFVVEHNHNNGLLIEETETAVYALEPNEQWNEETQQPEINPDYEQEQAIKAKQQRIDEIKAQLTALDQKRIRALCEPSTLTNESNQTWLEYYNNQVLQLREELQSLLREQ